MLTSPSAIAQDQGDGLPSSDLFEDDRPPNGRPGGRPEASTGDGPGGERMSPSMRVSFMTRLREVRGDADWIASVDALSHLDGRERMEATRRLIDQLTDDERSQLMGRRDREPGDGDRPEQASVQLTDEEVERLIEAIREIRPEMAERLDQAWAQGAENFRERLERDPLFRELGPIIRLRQRDPEMYSLRIEDFQIGIRSRLLAYEFQRAEASQQPALRAEILLLLERHFDVRVGIRELELQRFKERIDDLQSGLDGAYATRDDLIEEQLESLLTQRHRGGRGDHSDRGDQAREGEGNRDRDRERRGPRGERGDRGDRSDSGERDGVSGATDSSD